jgi:hypothetical protein
LRTTTPVDPRIPQSILDTLAPNDALTNGRMMYIRASQWERIKHCFADATTINPE